MKIVKNFSTIHDGNMKIYRGSVHDVENENAKNRHNRKIFLEKDGLSDSNLVLAGLVHDNRVVVVKEENKGKVIPECDGFITNMPGVILGVTAADCVPIFFWNKNKTVIGIVHAGWRGVYKNIVKEMLSLFVKEYGCVPSDIHAEIGPHILECHFEVQDDVLNSFIQYKDCIRNVGGRKYINLSQIIINQLTSAGVGVGNIQKTGECTFCNKDKYFSYRRDKPQDIEAMLAYIGIVE